MLFLLANSNWERRCKITSKLRAKSARLTLRLDLQFGVPLMPSGQIGSLGEDAAPIVALVKKSGEKAVLMGSLGDLNARLDLKSKRKNVQRAKSVLRIAK